MRDVTKGVKFVRISVTSTQPDADIHVCMIMRIMRMRSRSCPSDPQERVWGSGQRWGIPPSQTQEPEGESGLSQRGKTGGDGLRLLSYLLKKGSFFYLKIPNTT